MVTVILRKIEREREGGIEIFDLQFAPQIKIFNYANQNLQQDLNFKCDFDYIERVKKSIPDITNFRRSSFGTLIRALSFNNAQFM